MNPQAKLIELQRFRGELMVLFRGSNFPPIRFLGLCAQHYFNFSQVATSLGVSPTTLRKAFISYAGIPPKSWMTQQRVMLSVRLIREGRSLREVAREMGYSDYQHMAKEFRTVVEYTPKSMMKLLRRLQGKTK